MIEKITVFVLSLVMQIIRIILIPLNPILDNLVGPNLQTGLTKVYDFITLCCNNVLWVIDALAIPKELIMFIIVFITIKATIFIATWIIKIFVKWWGILW